ncbi:arginine N-succinyltransferase [Cellulomonas fimi]|uniref:Arginine N-succinyltransferase n=1 Tax=Cellulomonas fimi TaxID=1708 RepID=A0A7Y0LY50_CELFI|nr:arginine N-succinyltransferase [Cellulomonas fimi]
MVSNDEANGIDRAACESAARIDGINAAASLTRLPQRAGAANAPDAALPLVAAGEGIGPLLGLPPATGLILPPDIADGLGVQAGDDVRLTASTDLSAPAAALPVPDGPLPVGAVTETTVLGEQYAYAVLLPTSASGKASTCMVRVKAGYLDAARDALPAMLGDAGQDAVVADRLIGGTYARDFSAEYAQRGLKQAPWLSGTAVSLLWLLLVWIRRGRDGLYATLGADRATRTIIRTTEGLTLTLTSAVVATGVVAGTLAAMTTSPEAVITDITRHLTIATAVSMLGVLTSTLIPLRSPLAALKDH